VSEPRTARSRRTRAAIVAAVREELRRASSFSVEAVVARAGCSPATYYSHFPSKDDALAEAFGFVLADLERVFAELFELDALRALGVDGFASRAEAESVRFFRSEALVFRAGLARLPEHPEIRDRYRATEQATLRHIAGFLSEAGKAGLLPSAAVAERASAVVVLSQGLNNPRLLRASPQDPVHRMLAGALAALLSGDACGAAVSGVKLQKPRRRAKRRRA
jgi:AcrR family transcriptional regulator